MAMICTGLFGALSINNYRWGYYVISCLFFLIVLWGLVGPVAKVSRMFGNLLLRLWFMCCLRLLSRLWLCFLLGLVAKMSYMWWPTCACSVTCDVLPTTTGALRSPIASHYPCSSSLSHTVIMLSYAKFASAMCLACCMIDWQASHGVVGTVVVSERGCHSL